VTASSCRVPGSSSAGSLPVVFRIAPSMISMTRLSGQTLSW
jgi:hypothetical protein